MQQTLTGDSAVEVIDYPVAGGSVWHNEDVPAHLLKVRYWGQP